MKKILLVIGLSIGFSSLQAQYWQLYYPNAGTNPGNLNNDGEYPVGGGLSATWTTIQGFSATPVWSPNQTIPFSFSFNSSAVTQFKVSTSGILTFDVATPLAAPSYTKAALPNAAIPDKSVCIWGMAALGANDNIVSKTFGSAPNRQLWIQFSSYGYGSVVSDGTNFAYWSIVLEETTNRIHIVDNRTGGYTTTKQVSAGIQINASNALSVPTSPNLNALAGTDASPLDNSYYTFIPGVQPPVDANVISMTPKILTNGSFATVGGNIAITANIQNIGTTAMTSYTIKVNDGTSTQSFPQTTTIGSGNTAPISLSYAMASTGIKPIKLWVELTGDTNHLNDSTTSEFNGASFTPLHTPVFEEATGTWCQWCPRGAVFMDSLVKTHPDAVAIAVHNADPMTVAVYDAGMAPLIGGYPSGLVDRKEEKDPSEFLTAYTDHKTDFGVGDITINQPTIAGSAMTVKVDVKMAIATKPSYNYQLALVVTEDDVHGTTAAYNQANAYAGGANGVMGGFELLPSTVPAAQMYYNHVARMISGSFIGQTASLPGTMTAGSTYSYTFNWTAPAGTVLYKCKANVLLICGLSGEVHNGKWMGAYPTSVNTVLNEEDFNVFPNPSNDYLNLDFTLQAASDVMVSMTDLTGKTVYTNTLKNLNGSQGLVINTSYLSDGMYMLSVKTAGGNITRKVSVAH
jgi:hypothetical protein